MLGDFMLVKAQSNSLNRVESVHKGEEAAVRRPGAPGDAQTSRARVQH